ncbi:MAG: GC-type dockerin domain-anchored protein [Phycisphaerales bacterium]
MTKSATLCLLLAAGVPTPALATNEPLEPWPIANIYYNVRTGERLMTPIGAGPRDVVGPLWVNNGPNCGPSILIVENPDFDGDTLPDLVAPNTLPPSLNPPPEGAWILDWGDIDTETAINSITFAYATSVPDTDTDGDDIGDGVVGYSMSITFSDGDNGHDADRYCILDLTLTTLPGAPPSLPPGSMAVYTLTLDFWSLAPSLVFELGDTNGYDDVGTGLSGGAIYGHPTGADLDGDSRSDFSYGFRFDQSSLPLESRGLTGVLLVAPPTEYHLGLPEGIEDALDLFATGPDCPPGQSTSYLGTFDLGGYGCEPGGEIPFASIYIELGGYTCLGVCNPINACSVADTAHPAGVLNFDDVLAFLVEFGSLSFCADLAPPINVWDFSDVLAFLTAFGQGCP